MTGPHYELGTIYGADGSVLIGSIHEVVKLDAWAGDPDVAMTDAQYPAMLNDPDIKRIALERQICRNVEIFAAREIAAAREALFADCWCFSRKPSLAS
jgi:hypothetical protein